MLVVLWIMDYGIYRVRVAGTTVLARIFLYSIPYGTEQSVLPSVSILKRCLPYAFAQIPSMAQYL